MTEQAAAPKASDTPPAHDHPHHGGSLGMLALAALGVVFGDIGTSPLYALKECTNPPHGVTANPDNILGLLSLIFWSLMLVVTFKYLTFIMRADNQGEGGILALLALVPEKMRPKRSPRLGWVSALVIFGAALLYGDGVITPAISVLSAIEGLQVATTSIKPIAIPLITCVILFLLFAVQKRGTAGIGKVFGPIMILWFVTLAALGIYYLAKNPSVLRAVNPLYAVHFFATHKGHGFAVLGSVVLCITGGEALYADMGHFGRKPIRLAWYGLVLPALLLNYFGQGALLLQHPEASANPFYSMVPRGPMTYALVVLATCATIIASQALISGAYSLTHQGVQLGYLPRVLVRHTSEQTEGQIYIPQINWLLAAGCIALVLALKESTKLAAAYGIAVTGTMGITSIAYFVVTSKTWHWPMIKALPLLVIFLALDLAFFGANLLKFFDGGYIPILIGVAIFFQMAIWKRGRALMAQSFSKLMTPLNEFFESLGKKNIARVPGTAVFLSSNPNEAPPVLTHHIKHNKALHERVILLTVVHEHIPRVPIEKRYFLKKLDAGFYRLLIHSGFMQSTHVPRLLRSVETTYDLPIDLDETTYYLGRESILATEKGQMGPIAEGWFGFMTRNASSATAYFCLPPEQVVELGIQIDL